MYEFSPALEALASKYASDFAPGCIEIPNTAISRKAA
jgi:hypothetical protein